MNIENIKETKGNMSRKKYFKPIAYLGLSVVVGGALFGTAAWGTDRADFEDIPDSGTAALSDSRQVFQDASKYRNAIVDAIEENCNLTAKDEGFFISPIADSRNFAITPAKIKDSYDSYGGYNAIVRTDTDCEFSAEQVQEVMNKASDSKMKIPSPLSDSTNSYSVIGTQRYSEDDGLHASVNLRPQIQGDEEAGVDEEPKIAEYVFTVDVGVEANNASLSEIPTDEDE